MQKFVTILTVGIVMLFASWAVANPVQVYEVTDPNQDGISLAPGWYDEGGDWFPIGEEIVSSCVLTDETACTGSPYDDPGIPNVLVTITDISYGRSQPLWYVADPETSLTNYDMRVNGELAFKIDNLITNPSGINNPLVFESLIQNNLFDPGETWQFIIQDFVNALGGPPAPFDSLGIAGASAGWPPSTGSIIPEPATILLLTFGGLALLRRRK